METDVDVSQVTAEIAASLAPTYRGVLSVSTIEQFVAESFVELAGQAKVTDFLVLLTERTVSERLRAAFQPAPEAPPPHRTDRDRRPGEPETAEVLLVCGSDPTLGLVAAAMLDRLSRKRAAIRLAVPAPGDLDPGSALAPLVTTAALAAGLDLFRHRLEPLTPAAVESAGTLVSVTAGDACPVVAGKRYADWGLEPSEACPDASAAAALIEDVWTRAGALLSTLPSPVPHLRVIPL